ncbi:2-isopropylmalate synthase [Parvibaculum lavamentivorans DS-1]|uniref:2-isopropylmalate synthase n=1 Tax=Parvibaculum lavamentivorans (strain DS-1 / DSM 13023 / NCIMB 13966) TaxID=402881 RepID=LEU1_PARL1|nr:2-isopropylmalate synthase [Parvibaculum lavamentivorans]A7HP03.1 RecName: Full=2-isopropylmalate synthase; AltName: Full=Alpha-IPM synthase; AltName: Full=Alpha-isopropylmalate synthase [Parvibaculum lavamentivorans DS-1]ABS61636.1 2-isopropylmalate synthase [Parvibaculum lavamentivorans DS-1]
MLKNPSVKYRAFAPVPLSDRQWPSKTITKPPIWMSTDLRDGNQALFEPMNAERKLRMFEMLVKIGFKEIEAGFPSASDTDFGFIRKLVEEGRVPDDVHIEVLTQARPELIARTMESLKGAKNAIVHVYNATAPNFREVVFQQGKQGVKAIATESARQIKEIAATQPETNWTFQYSPEVFSGTELDFAKEVVDAVTEIWEAGPERKVVINLPATVEMATPNIYADQIEWMHRNLERRDGIILSVHPHNDRGTAVAAAELAIMAGADRVEGCLFGNGERTGNVDLVTLALNLYSQGIDPGLDFAQINEIARTAEYCTQLPIHPRHPYVGDLVFTAFSGSHQDAIKKGLAAYKAGDIWQVPYLPLDPKDLGRTYESIIRVNSQSGKGGVSYLLEAEYDLRLPRRLQVEFSSAVQRVTDDTGKEVRAADIWRIFEEEYLTRAEPIEYLSHSLYDESGKQGVKIRIRRFGKEEELSGSGNGPIDAAMDALKLGVELRHYEEHSIGSGTDAKAVAFMEVADPEHPGDLFGVGIDANIITASFKAMLSAANRAAARRPKSEWARLCGGAE